MDYRVDYRIRETFLVHPSSNDVNVKRHMVWLKDGLTTLANTKKRQCNILLSLKSVLQHEDNFSKYSL